MTIQFFAYDTPNARKISVALEEMTLAYEVRVIDITRGEQFEPSFLAVSPNNRIPAIIDPEGPAGAPVSVFESGAILYYLAEKTQQFWPPDLRARTEVMQWLMWQVGGFGPMPGQVHHFKTVADEADRRYGLERYRTETRRLYGVLQRQLQGRDYVAQTLSIADFAILGWVWRHERHDVDLAQYPDVRRWYEAMMARPGVARGFAVALR